jgi:hypothetical protein
MKRLYLDKIILMKDTQLFDFESYYDKILQKGLVR